MRLRLHATRQKLTARWRRGKQRFFERLDALGERHGSVAVVSESLQGFLKHRMTLHAGNFAYSAFLAIFPAVLVFMAVVGFIFRYNPSVMQTAIDHLRNLMPDFGRTTLVDTTESVSHLRSVVGALGIIGLLWTVSRISYSMDLAFEQIWETKKRSYLKKKAFAFVVLLLLGLVLIIGLFITFVSSQALGWVRAHTGPVFSSVTMPLGLLLGPAASFLIFATLYRVIPRSKPRFREIAWGALAAALLLDASEYLLSFYWKFISNKQVLYGSLGVVVGVVLWLYVMGLLIFFGAEIVHVMQQRRGRLPVEELPQPALPGLE